MFFQAKRISVSHRLCKRHDGKPMYKPKLQNVVTQQKNNLIFITNLRKEAIYKFVLDK